MFSLDKTPTYASTWNVIKALLKRDWKSGTRSGGGWFHAVYFFAVFACFMAFTVGPKSSALVMTAPGLLWLGTMLALQLSATDLFASDFQDESLKVIVTERGELTPYVTAKLIFVSLTSALPIIVLSPLYFIIFALDPSQAVHASLVFAIGCPTLILAASVSAALSSSMNVSGVLGACLSIPVAIPALIFGVSATRKAIESRIIWSPDLQILIAITLLYLVIVPLFLIAALRFGLE